METGTRRAWARRLGIAVSLAAALIYLAIGLGIVSIGSTTDGAAPDLLMFGVLMATLSLGTAGLIALVDRRVVLIALAAFEVLVIVGYVAVSGVRDPAFELWGVAIKVLQVAALGAVVYLAATWRPAGRAPGWRHSA